MIEFFTSPLLRAPTIGCMLMCLICSLVGVLAFVRKESLLGETLSHATYPGIMLGALLVGAHVFKSLLLSAILGAALACALAILLMRFCQNTLKMKKDTSLCFSLALFFGCGITLASFLQTSQSALYKKARVFLFGQAATISESYLYLYSALALIVVVSILWTYKQLQIVLLDPLFAKTLGLKPKLFELFVQALLILSVVVGIRSIGLFMLSGMLIGPAIAARQWTHKLKYMFLLSACFGILSGFLGIYCSVKISELPQNSISLATGPTIVVVSALISLISLIFSPKRGWAPRYLRILRFKKQCIEENILKSLWHFKQKKELRPLCSDIFAYQAIPQIFFFFYLLHLDFTGDLIKIRNRLTLTEKGEERAKRIVRMHRLWELYLVHIGITKDKVHHNAEEMEHIITPEIESQLLKVMKNPTRDPHNSPIPLGGIS